MEQKHRRAAWIDLAKMLAIVGVMVDHTRSILYSDKGIQRASFFSVGVFLIVMGVTSQWSLLKGKPWNLKDRLWRIGGPYLMATLCYCILVTGVWDLGRYLSCIVNFNASGPLYYVSMYLQFLVVVPILSLFTRCHGCRGVLLEVLGLIACMAIAWFTTNNTNILKIHGGGGKLLGGTFLVCVYIGVWFGKYCRNIRLGVFSACVVFLIFCVASVAWWKYIVFHPNGIVLDKCFPYKSWINPPSVGLLMYSCLVTGAIFSLGVLLDRCLAKVPEILNGVTYLGRHTLYIFLYHIFWLSILGKIPSISTMNHTLAKWVVYFSVMILGSLLLEFIMKLLKRAVVAGYCGKLSGEEESCQTFTENGAAVREIR